MGFGGLLRDDEGVKGLPRYDGESLREANELQWELLLERCLTAMQKTIDDCGKDKKSAEWKIMVAALLKENTSASNVWITGKLNMGVPSAVSRYVGSFREMGKSKETKYKNICAIVTT